MLTAFELHVSCFSLSGLANTGMCTAFCIYTWILICVCCLYATLKMTAAIWPIESLVANKSVFTQLQLLKLSLSSLVRKALDYTIIHTLFILAYPFRISQT